MSLTALMDLSARNVSHCFLNHLNFWHSQCLAALCFTQYMFCQNGFPFPGLLGNEETHPNHGIFHRSLKILQGLPNHLSSTLKRTTYLNFGYLTALLSTCRGPVIVTFSVKCGGEHCLSHKKVTSVWMSAKLAPRHC